MVFALCFCLGFVFAFVFVAHCLCIQRGLVVCSSKIELVVCSSKIELVVCSSKIELASHIVCSKSAEPLRDKLEKWKWTNFSKEEQMKGCLSKRSS